MVMGDECVVTCAQGGSWDMFPQEIFLKLGALRSLTIEAMFGTKCYQNLYFSPTVVTVACE